MENESGMDEENNLNLTNLPSPDVYNEKTDKIDKVNDVESNGSNNSVLDNLSNNESDEENREPPKKIKPRRIACIASDSEEEELHITPHNKSFNDDLDQLKGNVSEVLTEVAIALEDYKTGSSGNLKKKLKRIAVVDSDSDNESITHEEEEIQSEDKSEFKNADVNAESSEMSKDATWKSCTFAALCDSESEEEGDKHADSELENPTDSGSRLPKSLNKSKKSKSVDNSNLEKRMTGKEALQQRQEIHSESQRMLRESRISLPYHKPKSYSIKEFLQRRPRLSSALPDGSSSVSPSIAIKMSKEQLEIVTKKLKEREKEVEKFYKSDSESDEEQSKSYEIPKKDSPLNEDESTSFKNEEVSGEQQSEPEHEKLSTDANVVPEHPTSSEVPEDESTFSELTRVDDDQEQTSVACPIENATEENVQIDANLEKSNNSELVLNLEDMEVDPISTEKTEEVKNSTQPESKEEKNAEDVLIEKLIDKYGNSEQCQQPKRSNKIELLKQLGNSKPCLSGGPNQEIDLDEGVTRKTGIAKLMDRFLKHTAKKNVVKDKITLDVINFTQGELHKETVALSTDPDDELTKVIEKPGFRLRKLKDELQSQIAQQRSEQWQQKTNPLKDNDKENDEKSECGGVEDEDFLDDEEEEAELSTDADESEDDDYNEEDYEEKSKPSQVKNVFINEEAEESDADDDEQCNNDTKTSAPSSECETEINDQRASPATKKPLKRILKGFTEDSDEETDSDSPPCDKMIEITTKTTSNTWEEDDTIPPYQAITHKTPKLDRTEKKSDFSFLTPVVQLTGFPSSNSVSKFLCDSPASVFSLSNEPTQSSLKDVEWNTSACQKKLFSDSCDTLNSESNMEELAQLCSGKFPSPTLDRTKTRSLSTDSINVPVTTQDLMSICSGNFSDVPLASTAKPTDCANEESKDEEIANKTEEQNTTIIQLDVNPEREIKNLDEDGLIMELLDEEEMERFKKKFESPVASHFNNKSCLEDAEEVKGGGKLISDDEDEEDGDIKITTGDRKRKKKLTFSDDEYESEPEENNDEEIDLHDDDVSDCNTEGDNAVDTVIDYDSEENEIEFDQEAVLQKKLKPSDFFENEAELSESDWDSADEDEKGLDKLEFEQGDADEFDENQIRNDLEKIHMRRVLDQDNREIKILQELLLEDGELHGTGRQRQFRWRNVDDTENDDQGAKNEIETFFDEEESEEQWRKARYHREMYLKNKQEKSTDFEFEEDSNSQVLKLGHEVVRKSLTVTVNEKPKTASSPEIRKTSLFSTTTRGSFLARNDKFLNRLAQFTKATTNNVVGAPKNSKKFVFQTIEMDDNKNESTNGSTEKDSKKRKAIDGTPKNIKKLRLAADSVSPFARATTKKKQLFE